MAYWQAFLSDCAIVAGAIGGWEGMKALDRRWERRKAKRG